MPPLSISLACTSVPRMALLSRTQRKDKTLNSEPADTSLSPEAIRLIQNKNRNLPLSHYYTPTFDIHFSMYSWSQEVRLVVNHVSNFSLGIDSWL